MKLVLVSELDYDSPKNVKLISSFATDVKCVKCRPDMTKEDVLLAIGGASVTHLAFLYSYPGYDSLPFLYDLPIHSTDTPTPAKPKYHYFSDRIVELINAVKSVEFVVDILTCNLNNQSFKEEVTKVEQELGVNIRYSLDKTGNPTSGANWVLESDNVNVRDVYFTDSILEWHIILDGDISQTLRDNLYTTVFGTSVSYDTNTKTFTLNTNITWPANNADYITLSAGETFDGDNHTIDLQTLIGWNGLIASSAPASSVAVVKNLGIIGGTIADFSGGIIRNAQQYISVSNCYSTGAISGQYAGGICGCSAVYVTVSNCYSTGAISGQYAGGICGAYAGSFANINSIVVNEPTTISNCYSIGEIGQEAGGICGASAGNKGCVTVSNCYSTGAISGQYAGGISGPSVGYYATTTSTISNCYSIGVITGSSAGGLCGYGRTSKCLLQYCIHNTGNALGANSSTLLSDIISVINSTFNSTLFNTYFTSSSTTWLTGGNVLVNTTNYALPILNAFKQLPWNTTSYTKAIDTAAFATLIINIIVTTQLLSAQSVSNALGGTTGQHNTPVVVNLDVNITALGEIAVFGQAAQQVPLNILEASIRLPATTLYVKADASANPPVQENSLIEFWESSLGGDRKADLSGRDTTGGSSQGRNYTLITRGLANALQNVLECKDATLNDIDRYINAAGASPFNALNGTDNKYTTDEMTFPNFGELALGAYAHYLFGHVGATAAITNDVAFVRSMLSLNENGEYNVSSTGPVASSGITDSAADAKLAERLVQALISKDATAILAIANQVLGQDASRAMDQDNNPVDADVRQALKFMAGDIIYVNIKLSTPSVIFSDGTASGQKVLDTTLKNKFPTVDTAVSYALKITLR